MKYLCACVLLLLVMACQPGVDEDVQPVNQLEEVKSDTEGEGVKPPPCFPNC